MERMSFEEAIKECMIETGHADRNWRVKITGKESRGVNSDRYNVFVNVYKPWSRKPDILWSLCIDCVREMIFWEESEYYRCKD